MSRRKPAIRSASRPVPRRARRLTKARLAAIAVVAAGLAYLLWPPLSKRRGSPHHPSDPTEGMTVEAAFSTGLRLGGAGHHLASLPYFRRAVAMAPDSWTARENYATTLYNGAQEARGHLGKAEPATRSSVERMAMIAESFRQTDAASSLAAEPADRALVLYQRGQAFHTFGMAIDALVEFRKAAALLPSSREILRATASAETKLRTGGLAE